MTYTKRLKEFNSTQKYMNEVKFLNGLIQGDNPRVLDYGCGLGYCARILRLVGVPVAGYDLERYDKDFKYCEIDGVYSHVYFMHSLAHIHEPIETLIALRQHIRDGGKIIVITPNKDWLDLIPPAPGYKPDKTVIEHFTAYKLEKLFTDAGYQVFQQGQFGERKGDFNERLFLVAEL